MASLFPIIAVLILAIHVSQTISVEEILAAASSTSAVTTAEMSRWSQTPFVEIIGGVRAIFTSGYFFNDSAFCDSKI